MHQSRSTSERIVITGIGAVTDLGHTEKATWEGMREGRSGVSRIQDQEFEKYAGKWAVQIAGQVTGWAPGDWIEAREARRLDRFALLGVGAAVEAVRSSGVDFAKEDPERCGGVGGWM